MTGPLRIIFCCFTVMLSLAGVGVLYSSDDNPSEMKNMAQYENTYFEHSKMLKQEKKHNYKIISPNTKDEQQENLFEASIEKDKEIVTGKVLSYSEDGQSIEFLQDGMQEKESFLLGKTSNLLNTLMENNLLESFAVTLEKYSYKSPQGDLESIVIVKGAEQTDEEEITFSHAFNLKNEKIIIHGVCKWENKESCHMENADIIMHDLYLGDVNKTDDDMGAMVYLSNTNFQADNIYADTTRLYWNDGSVINITGVLKNHNYLYLDCTEDVVVTKAKIVNDANCYIVNKNTSKLNEALKNVDFINGKYLRLGWGLMVNSLENIGEGYFDTYSRTEDVGQSVVLDIMINHKLITTEKQREYMPIYCDESNSKYQEVADNCVIFPVFTLDGSLKEFTLK